MPCAFWTFKEDGTPAGKTVSAAGYSLEQFERCLVCKSFRNFFEDYQCVRPGGESCVRGVVDLFEEKAVSGG